jgi:hypothetical protein
MPGPDLLQARATVESLMDDACKIERNPQAGRDATPDPLTLLMVDPTPLGLIYLGACLLSVPLPRAHPAVFGLQDLTTMIHWLTLPLSVLAATPTAEPQVGDLVTMTASRRDPAAVGLQFLVTGTVHKTFAVSRRLELVRRTAA